MPTSQQVQFQANIPTPTVPIVEGLDAKGRPISLKPSASFYRFLVALWKRSGGGTGVDSQGVSDTVSVIGNSLETLQGSSALALFSSQGEGFGGQDRGIVRAQLLLQPQPPSPSPASQSAFLALMMGTP